MLPQRAKTYCWLFIAMSASVCANILLFQPRQAAPVAATSDPKALRVAAGQDGGRGAMQTSDTVRAIQRELKELNLYPGQLDGKATPLLHAAIMSYEQAQALPITGEPSQQVLREMIVGPSLELSKPAQAAGVASGSAAEKLIRDVRQKLAAMGYSAGNGDGQMTIELIQGIRAFERDNSLPQTGRISAQLVLQLQRSATAFKQRAG